MKNQKGVTLVELLVIIVIMGAVFVPISMMVNYSLETEKAVSAKNDVQREARFIMEYVTEKMREINVDWINDGNLLLLNNCENPSNGTCTNIETYLIYNDSNNTIKYGNGKILSENAKLEIIIPPINNSKIVRLTIDKTEINGEKITLQSEIGYERFGEIKPINIEENEENEGA